MAQYFACKLVIDKISYMFLFILTGNMLADDNATLYPLSTGDALYSLRQSLKDANNVLQSWDPTLVNPCTWFHVTCNNDNSVIRV